MFKVKNKNNNNLLQGFDDDSQSPSFQYSQWLPLRMLNQIFFKKTYLEEKSFLECESSLNILL
jgi:hypothetical protein